jgi:RNA polymerase-binding transcription factor DksA
LVKAKAKIKKKTVIKTKPGAAKSKKLKLTAVKKTTKKTASKSPAKKVLKTSAKQSKASLKKGVKEVTKKTKSNKPASKKTSKLKSLPARPVIAVSPASDKKPKKYKANKKVKYSASELKHFRDIILKERKAILESAKANMAALVDNESGEYKGDNLTYSTHMAEQGTDEMEREKNYMFVQRDEKYLGYLQDALMRIDQGTYGICVDCKDMPKNFCKTCPLIQKERLELVPITQHCIECKNIRG